MCRPAHGAGAILGLTFSRCWRILPPTFPFSMESAPRINFEQQSIGLQGVANARELGGYVMADGRRIRRGKLLRSGNLFKATDADMERLANVYHVQHIVDFRTKGEADHSPDRPLAGADYLLLPTVDPSKDEFSGAVGRALMRAAERSGEMRAVKEKAAADSNFIFMELARNHEGQAMARGMYPTLLFSEFTQLQYTTFFNRVLATGDGAVLWHCAQGKDRTGLGSALLLAALGASTELIIQDFALSNIFYEGLLAKLSDQMRAEGCDAAALDALLSFVGVNTPRFVKALQLVEHEYGSLHDYLLNQICLSEDDIAQLRDMFLED